VAAAEGAEGFSALDREFPVINQGSAGSGEAAKEGMGRETHQPQLRQRIGPTLVELLLVILVVLIAAGLCVSISRSVSFCAPSAST
jgi:hypothetical protein